MRAAAPRPRVGAIVVAAGQGTRLPADVPKPFLPLGGDWILQRSVGPLARSPLIGAVVVVVPADWVEAVRARLGATATRVVAGGAQRRDSVAAGLRALAGVDWILVHDGVRPFVTEALIARVLEAARTSGAAVPAVPVPDTVKEASGDRVRRTLDRSRLAAVQTPQAFRASLLRRAHARVPSSARATDDAQLVERLGSPVTLIPGDPQNVKITTPDDLVLARRHVEGGAVDLRVGTGYDIHRLAPDRRLVLGGVTIAHPRGLDGHSDADVLTHAVIDALLGAGGYPDIGRQFPPDDPAYRDAESLRLLDRVMTRLRGDGWQVANVDVAVVAEAPRLAPHVDAMRARLAAAIGIEPARVGIKATTGEGLGPIGRAEAIAATAVALIRKVDG